MDDGVVDADFEEVNEDKKTGRVASTPRPRR
jgi:hypothetical protein